MRVLSSYGKSVVKVLQIWTFNSVGWVRHPRVLKDGIYLRQPTYVQGPRSGHIWIESRFSFCSHPEAPLSSESATKRPFPVPAMM